MNLNLIPLPQLQPNPGTMIAICALPISIMEQPVLLALTDQLQLWQIELRTGLTRQLATIELFEFEPHHPVQFIVSPCGRLAGISNRFGKYAIIVELASGTTILSLERGEYHYDKSTYPLAFIRQNEQLLLAHGTDWNRLELTALLPEMKSLSTRTIPNRQGESDAEKAHYLDYFHGKLHSSPNGTFLAETGWVWAPAGVTRVWSNREWLANVWESEDGTSLDSFWKPLIDWDLPMVWLNDELLAIWGQLDEDLLDEEDWEVEGTQSAIMIYNAKLRARHAVITNAPKFQTRTDLPDVFVHPQAQLAASFTGKLFAWGHAVPLQVWDLSTQQLEYQQLDHSNPNIQPDLYHTEADLFLKIGSGSIQAWRYE
ncbi:hypothetical protein [Paenibacillus wenxiniae]|uniref:Uncharacterized protein n=1 Tax=Paenibacillus wenxiniae TaxID=1636843 RepID=A0ABW4RDG9_9BACL